MSSHFPFIFHAHDPFKQKWFHWVLSASSDNDDEHEEVAVEVDDNVVVMGTCSPSPPTVTRWVSDPSSSSRNGGRGGGSKVVVVWVRLSRILRNNNLDIFFALTRDHCPKGSHPGRSPCFSITRFRKCEPKPPLFHYTSLVALEGRFFYCENYFWLQGGSINLGLMNFPSSKKN